MKQFLRLMAVLCPVGRLSAIGFQRSAIGSRMLARPIQYKRKPSGQRPQLIKQIANSCLLITVLFFMCAEARAQQPESFVVTGKVISAASGVAIANATVTNKRTRIHAVTDRQGEYRIPARLDDMLIFSFVGYGTVEEEIKGREHVVVVLDSAENVLEEVEINAGYYRVKDRERTGSISRITADEIEKQPVRNPLEAMIGRMPGVHIEQTTGLPGGGLRIEIRGRNGISSGSRPLYVVNGVPFPDASLHSRDFPVGALSGGDVANEIGSILDGINPADIESIEVLRDADATAIYGSRGANGVVLITTKQGRAGKARLDVGLNTGFGQVGRRMELLEREQYLDVRRRAFINDGVEPTVVNAPDLLVWDTTRYTDWQEVLIGGTARNNRLNASLSGGTGGTSLMASANYLDEQSVYPTDDKYQKYGMLFNANHASEDGRLDLAFSFNLVNVRNRLPIGDYAGSLIQQVPVAPPIYRDDGTLNWENGTFNNPLVSTVSSYLARNANLNSRIQVGYSLLPGLKASASMGFNQARVNELRKFPSHSYNPSFNITTGNTTFGNGEDYSYIVEPMVSYNAPLWGGEVSMLVGGSYQDSRREMQTLYADGFTSEGMMDNVRFAPIVQVFGSSQMRYRYAAAFARLNYQYAGRYILNLTARRDGSSRFGPGRQFGNFGAVGVAWLFSEEDFVETALPFLSYGKLRGSYGVTGNDQIADYGYMHTYSALVPRLQGQIGMLPDRHANPDYGWETNRKLEAALEFAVAQGRVAMQVAWYRNRSANQLVGFPLTNVTGFPTVQHNLGATVQNSGWELELTAQILRRGALHWTAQANLSIPQNKLIEYPGLGISPHRTNYEIGRQLNMRRLLVFEGVDPQTGQYTFHRDSEGTLLRQFFDIGVRHHGGIVNTFSIGGVSASFFLQFSDNIGYNYLRNFANPLGWANQRLAAEYKGYIGGNPMMGGRITRGSDQSYQDLRNSDAILSENSFIKLRNMALGYDVPRGWLTRSGLGGMRLNVTGQNLFTWTDYLGLDPETGFTTLPPLRMVTFGLQTNF